MAPIHMINESPRRRAKRLAIERDTRFLVNAIRTKFRLVQKEANAKTYQDAYYILNTNRVQRCRRCIHRACIVLSGHGVELLSAQRLDALRDMEFDIDKEVSRLWVRRPGLIRYIARYPGLEALLQNPAAVTAEGMGRERLFRNCTLLH